MKITAVETTVARIPSSAPVMHSPSTVKGFGSQVYVSITVDNEVSGTGECWVFGAPHAYSEIIRETLAPMLLGRDPLKVQNISWDLEKATKYCWQGIISCAISGVELALWDVRGRIEGKSLAEILGGRKRSEVQAYVNLPYITSPQQLARTSSRMIEQGYRAIKINNTEPGHIRAVRLAVGEEVQIMIDAHHLWTPEQATKGIRELERYNIAWIEEPIWPPDDYRALAKLSSSISVPIAAGENEYTTSGFQEMVTGGSVAIVQPDVTKVGVAKSIRVSELAGTRNVKLVPHCGNTYLGKAATLNLLANIGPSSIYEHLMVELAESPLVHQIEVSDGMATVPEAPGLGAELDEEVIARYSERRLRT